MEEDIDFIKYYMKQYFNEDIAIEDDFKFEKAIENLLNRYKELEEENKNYKKYAVIMSTEGLLINGVKFSFNDYIPISVIQNKIDELKKEKLDFDNNFRIYTLQDTFEFQEKVLQELLEERNK